MAITTCQWPTMDHPLSKKSIVIRVERTWITGVALNSVINAILVFLLKTVSAFGEEGIGNRYTTSSNSSSRSLRDAGTRSEKSYQQLKSWTLALLSPTVTVRIGKCPAYQARIGIQKCLCTFINNQLKVLDRNVVLKLKNRGLIIFQSPHQLHIDKWILIGVQKQ